MECGNRPVSVFSCVSPANGSFTLHKQQKLPNEAVPERAEKWAILENVGCLIQRGNDGPRHIRGAYRATILKNLEELIEDRNVDLRHESLVLLCEAVPHLGDEIDHLMKSIFPKIVCNLGHWKLDVRLVTIHLLCVYLKYTTNLQTFLKVFVQHGVESPVTDIRRGSLISISTIFDIDMTNENLYPLVKSLGKQLNEAEPSFFYTVYFALRKINQIVRDDVFYDYLCRLGDETTVLYQRALSGENISITTLSKNIGTRESSSNEEVLAYGIFDPYVLEQLKSTDVNVKAAGVQSIRNAIQAPWKESDLEPRLEEFLLLLGSLLSDRSKRIRLMTLDIMETVIQKIGYRLGNYLQEVVAPLMRNFGCRETRISKLSIRTIHQLMREVHPMPIVRELLSHIQTQRSAVREEIINRVTAALLSFPAYDFDLPFLCHSLLPFLNETIPRLRQAVIECLVILAKVMESVGHEIAEESLGSRHQGDAEVDEILSIVEVRAEHQILPSCSRDGVIKYSHFDPQHFEVLYSKSSSFSNMKIHRELTKNAKSSETSLSGSVNRKGKSRTHSSKSRSRNTAERESFCSKSDAESKSTASGALSVVPENKDDVPKEGGEATESCQIAANNSLDNRSVIGAEEKCSEIASGMATVCSNDDIQTASGMFRQNRPKECHEKEFSFYSSGMSQKGHENFSNVCLNTNPPPPLVNPKPMRSIDRNSKSQMSLTVKQPSPSSCLSSLESQECLELQACCKSLVSSPEVILHDSVDTILPDSETSNKKTDDTDSERIPTRKSQRGDASCSSRDSLKEEMARNLWEGCDTVEEESDEEGCSTPVQSTSRISEPATSKNARGEFDMSGSENANMLTTMEEDLNRTFISPATSTPKKSSEGKAKKSTKDKFGWQRTVHLDDDEGLRLETSKRPTKRRTKKKAFRASRVLYFNDGHEMYVTDTSSQTVWRPRHKRSCQDVDLKADVSSSMFRLPPIVSEELEVSQHERERCSSTLRLPPLASVDQKSSQYKRESCSPAFRLPPIMSTNQIILQQQQERCPSKEMIYLPPINQDDSNTLICRQEEIYRGSFAERNPNDVNCNRQHLKDPRVLHGSDRSPSYREDDSNMFCRSSSKRKKMTCTDVDLKHKHYIAVDKHYKEKESSTQEEEEEECVPFSGSVDSKEETKKSETFVCEETENSVTIRHENASGGMEHGTRKPTNCAWETQFEESVQSLQPLSKPEIAIQLIKQANTILCGDDWKLKIEAMLTVIGVAKFHPFALDDYMQQIFTKLISEVKTSKPSAAGAAMLTIGHLFLLHRRALDPHVKVVVSAFLSKCGTKTFASSFNVVIKSMFYMLQGMQPQKAAMAFLNVGCRHPNKAVRETAAQFLTVLVEKMGHTKCLQSSRNLTDSLLNCAANFVTDGSPVTRYCGKRIFQILMKHQNFTKSLNKCLPESGLRNIHRILEAIRTKGLSEEVLPIRIICPEDI